MGHGGLGRLFKEKPTKDKKENLIMNNNILAIENRIALLRGRSGRDNGAIIKKLERRLRKLKVSV